MKSLFVLFLILSTCAGAMTLGIVQKVSGIVKVKASGSIKKSKVYQGYEIQQGDIISTYRNSSAVLQLQDGSNIVLGERSTISFLDESALSQQSGKIYYKIISREAKNRLKIKTQFAIIGIKGTTFIIRSDQNSSYVALKEGVIGVESIKEEFRLYKQKVMDEYQKFLAQQQMEFEKFKNAQIAEYVGTAKEFDLEAGNVVSFEGDKAVESELDSNEEFELFEKMLKE